MGNKIIAVEWVDKSFTKLQLLGRIDGQCTKLYYNDLTECIEDITSKGLFTFDEIEDYFEWYSTRD